MNVTAEKSCDEAYQLKELFRMQGTERIREQLAKYIADLKSGIFFKTVAGFLFEINVVIGVKSILTTQLSV